MGYSQDLGTVILHLHRMVDSIVSEMKKKLESVEFVPAKVLSRFVGSERKMYFLTRAVLPVGGE